jgi:hypothetical protein
MDTKMINYISVNEREDQLVAHLKHYKGRMKEACETSEAHRKYSNQYRILANQRLDETRDAEKKLVAVINDNNGLQRRVDEQFVALNELRGKLVQHHAAYASQCIEVNGLKHQNEELQLKADEAISNFTDLAYVNNKLLLQNHLLTEAADKTAAAFDDKNAEEINDRDKKIMRLEYQLNLAIERGDEKKVRLGELHDELTSANERVINLREFTKLQDKGLEDHKLKINVLRTDIAKLSDVNDNLSNAAERNENNVELFELSKENTRLNLTIEKMSKTHAFELTYKSDTIKALVSSHEMSKKQLQARNDTQASSISTLEGHVNEILNEKEDLLARVDNQHNNILHYQADLNTAHKEAVILEAELRLKNGNMLAAREELQSSKRTATLKDKTIYSLEAKIARISNGL